MMAGANLDSLPKPKRGFRLGKDTRRKDGVIGFRTVEQESVEDEKRIRGLERVEGPSIKDQESAQALADRLKRGVSVGRYGKRGKPPSSLASALFYREVRVRILGNVWEPVEGYKRKRTAMVTLMPQGMLCRADELMTVNPNRLKKLLVNDLDRRGITDAAGLAFACLDVEFDANRHGGVWQFHWHVIACGDKVERFKNLRKARKYNSVRTDPLELGLPEMPRVQIKRGLADLPDPITYCLKSWAAHRPTTESSDGTLERLSKRRIPSPYHEQWLLWMAKWKAKDLIVLNGMSATRKGFVISNR